MKTQEKADVNGGRECVCRLMAAALSGKGEATPDNRGFTLVELIVVMLIIGILATISISMFPNIVNKAKTVRCMMEIRAIESGIVSYSLEKGVLPNQLGDIGRGNLVDPWGRQYQYHPYSESGYTPYMNIGNQPLNPDSGYDLFSVGGDGNTTKQQTIVESASSDDIVRAGDGALIEKGSDY